VKTDETLALRTELESGEEYIKVRTIVAVPPGNHLELMRFTIPFSKEYVRRLNNAIWYCVPGVGLTNAPVAGFQPIEYTMTIPYGWTPADLDLWMQDRVGRLGLHIILLCDDSYFLHVTEEDVRAAALDLKQCDKTCGKSAQTSKLGVYETFGCPERITSDYLQRCKGVRLGKVATELGPLIFRWTAEWSTPTGIADTSVGGSIIHQHAMVLGVDRWVKLGMRRQYFGPTMITTYNELGLDPEFERDCGEELLLFADCATFLSGSWTMSQRGWVWHPMSATKLMKTKVPPSQVYPNKQHPLAWMVGAFSTSLSFRRDPLWDNLFDSYERYAESRGVDLTKARERWMAQDLRADGMRNELGGEKFAIADRFILDKLKRLGEVRGLPFDEVDWLATKEMLGCMTQFPCRLDSATLDWYRQVHYGKYE